MTERQAVIFRDLLHTSFILLVLGEIHPYMAPAQLVAIEVPLCALCCGHVKILAEAEALLPARVPVCHNPVRNTFSSQTPILHETAHWNVVPGLVPESD